MSEDEQSGRQRGSEERPVPPRDRVAHLGHIEHPAEMYAIMKPVPNRLLVPAEAGEVLKSFASVTESLLGGSGKTVTRLAAANSKLDEVRP
ncbi:hypothetical protein ACFXN2_01980 [Streptomyces kronopolitis]|uniref:hypothetical protein n=1 Tax=Streptomyces kronopolitis TaxID=1612435 RepID=UPI00367FD0F5